MTHAVAEPKTAMIKDGQDVRLIGLQGAKTQFLCFHGGGGVGGDPAMMDGFAGIMAEGDEIAMSIARYRVLNSTPGACLEDMIKDAEDALVWAKRTLKGDNLWVLGASFGGLLALQSVLRHPDGVAGLILLNPVTNTGAGGFFNRVVDPSKHAHLSPLKQFKDSPLMANLRCLIVHGTRDDVVPIEASRAFAAIWPRTQCDLVEIPNATHGFFNRAPRNAQTASHIRRFLDTAPPKPAQTLPDDVRLVCCVGGQKAGTSWLYDQIIKSPQVHDSTIKERHYFDVLWLNNAQTFLTPKIEALKRMASKLQDGVTDQNSYPLREANRLTDHLAPYATDKGDHGAYIAALTKGRGTAPVVCDFTPAYCGLSAGQFREIDQLGDVRFIYVLREPVARMWSQIRMKIAAEGGGNIDERCIAHGNALCDGGRMAQLFRADYGKTLDALDTGTSRSLVVFYEELFEQDTFDRIADFAGIDRFSIEGRAKVNEGVRVPLPDELERKMTMALTPQYEVVKKRFGKNLPRAWQDRFEARNMKHPTDTAPQAVPVSGRARSLFKTLKNKFAGSNDATQIVFLHVPKTAGQSIVQELRRVCGGGSMSPVRTHTQAKEDEQLPSGYRVYAGHLDWVDLETLSPDRFSFSVLRSPRERIASFYFYLLREAQALTAEQLQLNEHTGKRNILNMSPEEYFFGGGPRWQMFIQDHYNNFYCTYFVTRRMRGWRLIKDLSEDALIEKAVEGTQAVSGIYGLSQLDRLETDLSHILGNTINLQTTRVNTGPPAKSGTRWNDLMERLGTDESREKLTRFATRDEAFMRRLGLAAEFE